MKKVVLIVPILALLFSSCKTAKVAGYSDDVYSRPTEELHLAKIAAEQKMQKEAVEKQKQENERMAQITKDIANPNYKDPTYNKDDYYDYQYASKVKRFNNPIPGAGYYDNYYTNSYTYNQNPAMYGTSIYSSYNYLMPSNQFNNYGNGISLGYGYNSGYNNNYGYNQCMSCGGYNGYNSYGSNYGYNPYGFNSGYYSGYGGYNPYGYNYYGYNPYNSGYGYNSYGYSNGYNNTGWGYYNGHDPNSAYSKMTYGPRGSNGGGNNTRTTTAGMAVPEEFKNSERQAFMQSVVQKQEETPRFTEIVHHQNPVVETGNMNNANVNGVTTNNSVGNNTNNYNGTSVNPVNTDVPAPKKTGFWSGLLNANNSPFTNQQPTTVSGNNRASGINSGRTNNVAENPTNNAPTNAARSNSNATPTFNTNSGWPSGGNSGGSTGGSSPRGGGGGGNSRPR